MSLDRRGRRLAASRIRGPSRFRNLIVVIAMLCAGVLAWRIVAIALAQAFAGEKPATALWWQGDQPEALIALADRTLKNPSPGASASADAYARKALRARPLSPGALDVLAQVAQRRGQGAKAAALERTAAAFFQRDLTAQGFLFTQNVGLGKDMAAIAALDAIIRAHPEILEGLISNLAPLLDDAKFTNALVAALARDPPWRPLLLGVMVRQARNPAGVLRLFNQLQTTSAGLTTVELRAYLAGLIADRRYDEAYLVWLRSLPKERLSHLGFLYNGQFEYPISDMPFDWTFLPAQGVEIEVSPSEKGAALSIGFFGSSISFENVTHDLMLSPGRYTLTGFGKADLQNDRGLRWRIACVDHAKDSLGASPLMAGDMPWHPFAVDFEIPATDCGAQTMILELPAQTGTERSASGVVSFAGLDIQAK